MSLPDFNQEGDLPPAIHAATLDEAVARFGRDTPQRIEVTTRLLRIVDLARRTMMVDRIVIFGSYITAKPNPNDVDLILVMRDDFRLESWPLESAALFEHQRAHAEFGASVFWIRPAMLLQESVDDFLARWQFTRSGGQRGIVEIR
jgi:hypothetical protein